MTKNPINYWYQKYLQEKKKNDNVVEVDFEKELDKFFGMYRKDGRTYDIEDNEECVDWKIRGRG